MEHHRWGSFTDNDAMEANHGLSFTLKSSSKKLYFSMKSDEIARMENISLEESLEIFGIWNRHELAFQTRKPKGLWKEPSTVDLGEMQEVSWTRNQK